MTTPSIHTPTLADYYSQAISAAPRLAQTPDLVAAAATSGDPTQTAQVLAQTGDASALATAATKHTEHHSSLLGGLLHDVEGLGSDAFHGAESILSYLGKPLADVQHDYRYIHDLWTKSDPVSATLATLGVIGGAAAGTLIGEPTLGADAAMALEAHLAGWGAFNFINPEYQKIYKQSEGEKISPGRDLAHLLGAGNTDKGFAKILSGVGDLVFDFTSDPIAIGARASAGARTSETGLTATYAARKLPAVKQFFLEHGYGGLGLTDSAGVDALDRINAARNNPQYERALGMIADTVRRDGAGGVVSDFPTLARTAPLLAEADTPDKVHEVFLGLANSAQLSHGYNLLPSRTITRAGTMPLIRGLKNIGEGSTEGGFVAALNPLSDVTLTGAAAQKIRTFSGYLPYTIDRSSQDGKQLLNLSGKQFDLMDPGSLTGMYRSLKFSMSEQSARTVISDIALAQAAGHEDQVRTMWLGAHKQMLVAAGIPDDHALVRQVSDAIADAHVNNRAYAYGHETGVDANYIHLPVPALPTDALEAADATVVKAPAAVWSHQTSSMSSYPSFWAVKNSVRGMNTVGRYLGGADEWVNRWYTRGIFKPLALVNMGFGLRVAVAEALPAAFRYGALNMLQNRIAASSAKNGYKIDSSAQRLLDRANVARETGDMDTFTTLTKQAQDAHEIGHLTAAISHVLGGAVKALKVDDETLDVATHLVHTGQGHIVWGVGKAGESAHREAINAVDRQDTRLWLAGSTKAGAIKTGNHTYYAPHSSQYTDLWQTRFNQLAKEEPARRIAQDIRAARAEGKTDAEAATHAVEREASRIRGNTIGAQPYEGEREKLIRYRAQSPENFAAARVDDVRNLLTGHDGTFHDHLAKALAQGKEIDQAKLDLIDPAEAPRMLPGQEIIPLPPSSPYAEAINKGFKVLVDPVINHLSREPLFLAAVKEQLPALRRLVRLGVIDEDQMYTEAYYRATEAMLPQIHNVQLRSQFAAVVRNFMPFYFAQEQAMKRTAHLAARNPGAIRQYQQISHALADPNFIHTDDNGNRSVLIPLAGGIGSDILNAGAALGLPFQSGLPLNFTGSTSSLRTVLPELTPPGVSPLVSMPLNEMAKFFPEWTPAVKAVVGEQGLGQTVKSAFIPNQFLRNSLSAYEGDTNDRQFANAFTSALAAAAYHKQLPPADATPQQQHAFLDRVKNNARSIMFMKGVVATFSPLAPRAVPEDMGFRDEFYALVKKEGFQAALQTFLAKHGDEAISYTIAKSENPVGANVPSTDAALAFIQGNRGLINEHLSAAYFVPQGAGDGDSQVLHSELVTMHLRSVETPQEFMDQMYIKSGSERYYSDRTAHEDALKHATTPEQVDQENHAWSAYVQGLMIANPTWADDFTSNKRDVRAHNLYQDMLGLFQSGQAPESPQTEGIAQLLLDYQHHAAILASIPSGSHNKTVEKDAFSAYLDTAIKDHPELSNVIKNVFSRLDRTL